MSRTADGVRLPWCRRTGRIFVLGGCAVRNRSGKIVPCGQLDCLTCAEGPGWSDPETRDESGVVARRRGKRLWSRFGGPDLARVVITWPDAQRIPAALATLLREAAHDAVQAWACEVWAVDEVGVHSYAHPAGDLDPERWRPHVHLQVPLFGALLSDTGGTIRQMGRLYPHFERLPDEPGPDGWTAGEPGRVPELDRLRDHVAGILEAFDLVPVVEVGGAWHVVEGEGYCLDAHATRTEAIRSRANAWYQYARDDESKLHGLIYDARAFPAWFAGDIPRDLRIGRSTGLLAPNRHLSGLAAWRDAVRGGAVAERDEPDDVIARVRAGVECYCGCGRRMAVVGCEPAQDFKGVVVDAFAFAPTSAEVIEAQRYFGRGDPRQTGPPTYQPTWSASERDARASKDGIPF